MLRNLLINTPLQRGDGTDGEALNRISGFPKPRRGGLFIGAGTPLDCSFCFSAARIWRKRTDPVRTVTGPARLDMAVVAPPKNKKKKWAGSALAINRPPLRGFGGLRGKQNLSGPLKHVGNAKC